jgi:hypothetical protein
MLNQEQDQIRTTRETAYQLWEREGRPEGRALDHWLWAVEQTGAPSPVQLLLDEEKVLEGRPDADMPAILTKDVKGG